MRSKVKKYLLIYLITLVCSGLVFSSNTYANEGGAGEGSTVIGGDCKWWCTGSNHGLAWAAYKLTEDLPATEQESNVHLYYTESTGGPINFYGCTAGTTLYNFGFIAYDDGDSVKLDNGKWELKPHTLLNTQVGTISRGNSYYRFNFEDASSFAGAYIQNKDGRSNTFEGKYNRRGNNEYMKEGSIIPGKSTCSESTEADTVARAFCEMQKADAVNGTHFIKEGLTWDNVGWFCWDADEVVPEDPTHATRSVVEVTNNGSRGDTKIKQAGTARASISINVGETVGIKFSHNAYSSIEKESITAKITRESGISSKTSNYTITGSSISSALSSNPSGVAQYRDTDENNSVYYGIAQPTGFIHSDSYSVTFKAKGTYELCESVKTGNASTSACVIVNVSQPVSVTCDGNTQPAYKNSNIDAGTNVSTSLVSSNVFPAGTTIYAKPTDVINFVHCYYPGSQTAKISDSDSSHTLTEAQWNVLRGISAHLDDNPKLTYSGFTDTIGARNTFAAQSNSFNVNTSYSNSAIPTPTITVETPFVPTSQSGNNVAFSNTIGDKTTTSAKSNSLTVAASGVGTVISQGVLPSIYQAKAINQHSSWSKSDWAYTYDQSGSGTEYVYRTNCSTRQQELKSYVGTTQGSWYDLSSSCSCPALEKDKNGKTNIKETDADGNVIDHNYDTCTLRYTYKTHATGLGTGTYTVYHQVNGKNAGYYVRNISHYSNNSSTAYVYIPYNYSNTSTITIGTDKIYAGETFNVGAGVVTVSQRYNGTTQGTYATKTPTTTAKLYVFHSANDLSSKNAGTASGNGSCSYYSNIGGEECREVSSTNRQLNTSGNWDGSTETGFFDGRSINAYDIPAGNYICIGLSIWPYTTNGNTDMGNSGNNQAYYSKPACQKVYKKPSFQVWGGGVYSNGNMSAAIANKNNLSGYVSYQTSGGATNTFGSWVEQAIVSNGTISGIASGAATGYTTNNKGNLSFNPGGIAGGSNANCLQAPLTIPNTDYCRNSSSMKSGIKTTGNAIYTKIYDTVVSGKKFKDVNGSSINLDSTANYAQDGLTRGTRLASGSHVSGGTLKHNFTHIIYSTGDIYIDGDLAYENFKYTSAVEVPQYIIYSGASVNIKCSVKTINALIVATNGLNTCYDGGDETDTKRNNQLTVNGIVIAKSLDLGRTYGAGIGNKSGIPAEIFNLSLTTRFFGKESSTEKPTLYTVYLRELSPRY